MNPLRRSRVVAAIAQLLYVQSAHVRGVGAGEHREEWNGRDGQNVAVASGVYLYRLRATPVGGGPGFEASRRMVLLK